MNFSQSISTCFAKYATFSGRAGRSEFWWFYLFILLMGWGASVVGAVVLGELGGFISLMFNLAVIVPSLAVTVRRLHDTGRSGWWILITITIIGLIPYIIWLASTGNPGENAYGPPPEN